MPEDDEELLAELKKLRIGEGMTLARVMGRPTLLTRLGVRHAGEAVDMIVAELGELEESRTRRASSPVSFQLPLTLAVVARPDVTVPPSQVLRAQRGDRVNLYCRFTERCGSDRPASPDECS
jgi:hypothetical protein